ncbi:hypothetical protein EJ05DRAFT_210669 [Pseudovirgaria hyperparasitica]|uniref:RBR-type E3 ubiquitin transferase n=1 Tax=Pseudovirgaria hyperparasitica TaxID=470096 RepID=A0A6A6VRJ8_9PEZI|nr:uncharacterized protein EJ05DRAFT_210669 [Pseudovirgaria hyperparasitica]KAF2753308.1 hypothetical protein EJ05DRAFT_210669 [Pseudovirgaria hyperparasitica]
MSRVQQLRLRFEKGNESQITPRNVIFPSSERSILRDVLISAHGFQKPNRQEIPIIRGQTQRQPVRISQHIVPSDSYNIKATTAVSTQQPLPPLAPRIPLNPVRSRIQNLEGILQKETRALVEHKVQNEKLLCNKSEAVVRRQSYAKERMRRELEEREARRRWCVSCFEEADMSDMVEAPCRHWYCPGCLSEAFTISLTCRREFRCCSIPAPISLLPSPPSNIFVSRYNDLVLELSTPNPLYCHNRRCSAFLPPYLLFGPDIAHCVKCYAQTCRHCRGRAHTATVCAHDVSMNMAIQLIDKEGWKSCPTCRNVVERSGGCLHITCRCMTEFCYRCGGPWKDCESSCGDNQ